MVVSDSLSRKKKSYSSGKPSKFKPQKSLRRKKKGTINTARLGAGVMFFSLIILASYLITKTYTFFGNIKEDRKEKVTRTTEVVGKIPEITGQDLAWDDYTNTEFGYSVSFPKLLYKAEVRDAAGYLHFVRFEETKFSQEKGIAVGVSQADAEEEIDRLKREFTKDGGSKIIKEEEVVVDGVKGARLDFEPQNEGEKRSVVVFSKGGYSYSLSTVPEQITRLIESFKFL